MKNILKFLLIFAVLLSMAKDVFGFSLNKTSEIDFEEKLSYVNIEFFEKFQDEFLNQYIKQAIKCNHNAKMASWKVEQFRQNVKMQFSYQLPSISVAANYAGVHIPTFDNFRLNANAFILPFLASYEADFLLKNSDKTKSKKKEYEAEKYEEQAIYITLANDVASAYLNVLQYEHLLKLQNEIVKTADEKLSFETKKFNQKIISFFELNSAKKNLEDKKQTAKKLHENKKTSLHQLAFLIGSSPNCIEDLQTGSIEKFEYTGLIPSYIQSDVIFERPDVKKAEKQLEKAKIDIRIARKEFFPSFPIRGFYIFNTISPGNFFSFESTLALIFAGALQDIFKGGIKLANLKSQQANYKRLFENYLNADLNALKEVNDSLVVAKYEEEIDNSMKRVLNLANMDLENSRKKLAAKIISKPDYLDYKLKFLETQQKQTQTKTKRIAGYLTLYKATGGKI